MEIPDIAIEVTYNWDPHLIIIPPSSSLQYQLNVRGLYFNSHLTQGICQFLLYLKRLTWLCQAVLTVN